METTTGNETYVWTCSFEGYIRFTPEADDLLCALYVQGIPRRHYFEIVEGAMYDACGSPSFCVEGDHVLTKAAPYGYTPATDLIALRTDERFIARRNEERAAAAADEEDWKAHMRALATRTCPNPPATDLDAYIELRREVQRRFGRTTEATTPAALYTLIALPMDDWPRLP